MEEGWERPPRLDIQRDEMNHLVEPAFPGERVADYAVIAAGLANTNIRFRMRERQESHVLRLHTRDPGAARRERDLMIHLADNPRSHIPVAPLLYSDPIPARGKYPYSVWGFVEGRLLEDLFATLPTSDLVDIAGACGRVLAAFAAHPFQKCGELGPKLEITKEYGPPSHFVPEVVHQALFHGLAGKRLGTEFRDALWMTVERTSPLLRTIDGEYTLIHSDYKRSNLIMKRSAGTWSVAAVLDWEFACAGPSLVDVGIFLRAGDRLPDGFREAFVSCYREAGGNLPSDWLPLSRLVDVVSQVIFLNDSRERPRVFTETIGVLKETLRILA